MGLPLKKTDRHYTYGDYRSWPEDERWELIDGSAWNMSVAPTRRHQDYSRYLEREIDRYLEDKDCMMYRAPFDVLLPEVDESKEDDISTVLQPDISVICDSNKLTEKGCTGAPDWIVEIISPATAAKDFDDKLHLYERHGVREYWVVDPGNKCVHVFVLSPDAKRYEEPEIYVAGDEPSEIRCTVLDGLSIDVQVLFE